MPAIQPQKLKTQVALLAEQFQQPSAFVRGLRELLEFYADRVSRHGQAGMPKPLLKAYKIPPQVLRQISLSLEPALRNDPQAALKICQALWAEERLEPKQLAIRLLAQLPPESSQEALDLLEGWITPEIDTQLLDELLTDGAQTLRRHSAGKFLERITGWLERGESFSMHVGLRALYAFAQDETFQNLPAIFRLLQPYVLHVPPPARIQLIELISALGKRFPRETAFFLKKTASLSNARDAAWVIRQVLPAFEPQLRADLRQAARRSG